jgi:hypothetical protein
MTQFQTFEEMMREEHEMGNLFQDWIYNWCKPIHKIISEIKVGFPTVKWLWVLMSFH